MKWITHKEDEYMIYPFPRTLTDARLICQAYKAEIDDPQLKTENPEHSRDPYSVMDSYINEWLASFSLLGTKCDPFAQTSHKSPNIKWQKIAFYLKMLKRCYFFTKTTFFGQDAFNIWILHYFARFFKYFWLF